MLMGVKQLVCTTAQGVGRTPEACRGSGCPSRKPVRPKNPVRAPHSLGANAETRLKPEAEGSSQARNPVRTHCRHEVTALRVGLSTPH